jgi:hypothetical protein
MTCPADLKKALTSDAKALETWEDITPLARNEWICWIESAKKQKQEFVGLNEAVPADLRRDPRFVASLSAPKRE